MKARIRFTKHGAMCYIGHLDMMRYFQKAIRRAKLDIAYSNGFNPHQILSFASPLGLGMTSDGEYFDAEFVSCEDSKTMIDKLNAVMVDGIRVTSFKKLPDEGKFNAMASLAAAKYEISLYDEFIDLFNNFGGVKNALDEIINMPEIMIHKKTKRSETDADIKPLIYDVSFDDNKIKLFIAAGSALTLKPTAIIDVLLSHINNELNGTQAFKKGIIRIHRVDQLTMVNEKYVSLGEIGDVL